MLLAAGISFALTTTTVLARKSPDLAARLTLWPSSALAQSADQRLQQTLSPAVAAQARGTAVEVLRHNPMDVVAARVIGTADSLRARPSLAMRAFTYAERLSRRDAGTQLWLIERSVATGDVAAALKHYDRAMLTSRSIRPVLLPVLVAATNSPAVRDALFARLRQRPLWWRDYLEEQVRSGTDAQAIVQAITATRLKDAPDETGLYSRSLTKLAGTGHVVWAAKLDGRPMAGVRNGSFSSPEGAAPFSWSIGDQPALGGTVEPRSGAHGNALSIVSTGQDGAEVAKQLLALKPGTYQLQATYGNVPPEARVWLTLTCVGPKTAPTQLALLQPEGAGASTVAVRVIIPPRCEGEWLQIWASRTSDQPDQLPWVDDISIRSVD